VEEMDGQGGLLEKLESLASAGMWRSVELVALLSLREASDSRWQFELRLLRARAAGKMGETRRATEELEQLASESEDERVPRELLQLCFGARQMQEAIVWGEKIARRSAGDNWLLGCAYEQMGGRKMASRCFMAVLRDNECAAEALEALCRVGAAAADVQAFLAKRLRNTNVGNSNNVGNTNVGNSNNVGNTNVGNSNNVGNTNVGNSNNVGNTNSVGNNVGSNIAGSCWSEAAPQLGRVWASAAAGQHREAAALLQLLAAREPAPAAEQLLRLRGEQLLLAGDELPPPPAPCFVDLRASPSQLVGGPWAGSPRALLAGALAAGARGDYARALTYANAASKVF
jgi:tetratricopeptide (TPR) repeat protein